MGKISVIVPIYNTSKYLDRCILSIINQSYKNIEIILIDDGSTDNSLDICLKYQKKDKRIKVIYGEKKGVSFARNLGLKAASGDYISFADSDDFISKDMLLELCNCLKNNDSDVSVCGYDFYKNNKYKFKKGKNYVLEGNYKYNGIFNFNCFNKLYKRSLFDDVCFDDKSFAEDAYVNFKILKKVNRISYILDKPLYHYRVREGSASLNYGPNHFEFLDVINEIIDFLKENDMDALYKKALVYRYINLGEIIYNVDRTLYNEYYELFLSYKTDILKVNLRFYDRLKVVLFTFFPKVYLKFRNY